MQYDDMMARTTTSRRSLGYAIKFDGEVIGAVENLGENRPSWFAYNADVCSDENHSTRSGAVAYFMVRYVENVLKLRITY